MIQLFENKKRLLCCSQFDRISAQSRIPTVNIEMAGKESEFNPIEGKIDSGASITLLNLTTARTLHISDIKQKYVGFEQVRSASDNLIDCFFHKVQIRMFFTVGDHKVKIPCSFSLKAGFSETVKRNLFGMDLFTLKPFWMVLGAQAVYFVLSSPEDLRSKD